MRAKMGTFSLQKTTGIYVGAKEVYAAQLKWSLFGPQLVKFARAEIQTATPADDSAQKQAIVQALRRLVRENNISTKKVMIAFSGQDVLIRYFQMPRIPRSEWETAIKFEAKKYIPFKIEELMWDFHVVLPKAKAAKMDVTFLAVKTEVAKRNLALFEQAGVKPAIIEPAPFSLLRLFAAGKQLAKDKPTAIVDVDYGIADINIVKGRSCYLTRDVSLPTQEENIYENLLNEIRMSMDYYEKLFPTQVIGKILLCGEADTKDWDKSLAQDLKIPVEKADLASAVKIKRTLPPLSLAVAVGLGLRGLVKGVAEVNLGQVREVKTKLTVGREISGISPLLRGAVIRAGILSFIGLLALYLVMSQAIGQENKRLQEVILQRPKINLPVESFSYASLEELKNELSNKVAFLNSIIDQRIYWTDKFSEIPKIILPGVWFTELNIKEDAGQAAPLRSLLIRGVAYHEDPVQEIGIVTKFVSALKESKTFSRGFSEIKLDSMASGDFKGLPVKNFVISCSVK
ncbi:MAG: pilus assembly protein PilM [Candidatus Omnitrophica bacterium]|nr:pilus assembly protein PilM [Candidatus Omnitrophota bacterium]